MKSFFQTARAIWDTHAENSAALVDNLYQQFCIEKDLLVAQTDAIYFYPQPDTTGLVLRVKTDKAGQNTATLLYSPHEELMIEIIENGNAYTAAELHGMSREERKSLSVLHYGPHAKVSIDPHNIGHAEVPEKSADMLMLKSNRGRALFPPL